MSKEPEKPINFDTVEEAHEEIKALVDEINQTIGQDSDAAVYLASVADMHRFFEDTYSKNMRLLETCQEYNAQVIAYATKIKTLLDISESDRSTMKQMKSEYEEASKTVVLTHAAEEKAKNLLATLRANVVQLSEQVRRGEAFCFGEDSDVIQASQDVKNLLKEKQDGERELAQLQAQLEQTKIYVKHLGDDITSLKKEEERLNAQIDQHGKLISELKAINDENYQQAMTVKPQIAQQRETLDKGQKEKNGFMKRKKTLKQQQYDLMVTMGQLKDEAKAIKDRINRRNKHLADLNGSKQRKEEHIDLIQRKMEDSGTEITELNKQMEDEKKKAGELSGQFDAIMGEAKNLSDKKAEVRKIARNLRTELIDTTFKLSQSDSETRHHERNMTAHQQMLENEKKKSLDAAKETQALKDHIMFARLTIRGTKKSMQSLKDKILGSLSEIDDKKVEIYQTETKTLMTKESTAIIDDQNQKHLEILAEYQRKIYDQSVLSDKLREERNIYKRQYEVLEEEHHEQKIQFEHLEKEYNELQERMNRVIYEIVKYRHKNIRLSEEEQMYEQLIENATKGIQEMERAVSRLQAEGQTLNYILNEAEHDAIQIQQERDRLFKNLALFKNEHSEKLKALDDLRSQIQTDETLLHKCSEQFREKNMEIERAVGELTGLEAKRRDLEKKRQKVEILQIRLQKLSTENLIENQKTTCLIHEFAVKRNVHRWNALEAVDPGLVKQLKYRLKLTGKLDAAHRELLELQKQRDRLKTEVEELKSKHDKAFSRYEVEECIRMYTENLKAKDAELAELKTVVNGNKDGLNTSMKTIADVRMRVNQRIGNVVRLRTRSQASKRPQTGSTWFITEAPLDRMIGGGFRVKTPSGQDSVPDSPIVVSGHSVTPTSNRRAKSSLLDATKTKQIKRPRGFPMTPIRRLPIPSLKM